jgi:hypothetical protein
MSLSLTPAFRQIWPRTSERAGDRRLKASQKGSRSGPALIPYQTIEYVNERRGIAPRELDRDLIVHAPEPTRPGCGQQNSRLDR